MHNQHASSFKWHNVHRPRYEDLEGKEARRRRIRVLFDAIDLDKGGSLETQEVRSTHTKG
jgi:hypothetical protein